MSHVQSPHEVESNRQADYPVNSVFVNRWSPRSFAYKKVTDEDLYTVLEAARWAPSATNAQPWRFIIAKTDEQLERFHEFISERNRLWSDKVPILILLVSQKTKENGTLNRSHSFDAGAAWFSSALQAHLLGLSTRAIAGFDVAKARDILNVPDDYDLHVVIALGYRGERDALVDEKFRELEQPNLRRPIAESIIDGKFEG